MSDDFNPFNNAPLGGRLTTTNTIANAAQQPAAPAQPQTIQPLQGEVRTNDGSVTRINPETGTVETFGGVQRYQHTPFAPVQAGASVLSSVQGENGISIAPLNDRSTVQVGITPDGQPIRTSVAVAVTLGALVRTPNGGYADTGAWTTSGEVPQHLQQQATPQAGPQAGPIDEMSLPLLPEAQTAMAAVRDSLPPGFYDELASTIAINGAAAAVAKISQHSSIPGDKLAQTIEFIEAAHIAQLAHALNKQGCDVADFARWAHGTMPGEFRSARLAHIHSGSLAEYKPLVDRFLRSSKAAPTQATLQTHGLNTRTERDGTVMVEIEVAPGKRTWTSVQAATINGWL